MMLLPQEKGALVVEEGFLVLSGEKSEGPEGTLGTPCPLLKAQSCCGSGLVDAAPLSRASLLFLSLISHPISLPAPPPNPDSKAACSPFAHTPVTF